MVLNIGQAISDLRMYPIISLCLVHLKEVLLEACNVGNFNVQGESVLRHASCCEAAFLFFNLTLKENNEDWGWHPLLQAQI